MEFQLNCLKALRSAIADYKKSPDWTETIKTAEIHNPWFTQNNIELSLDQWLLALSDEQINQWLKRYDFSAAEPRISGKEVPSQMHDNGINPQTDHPKTVGIIGAGNIPFVVMHDVICAVLAGFKVKLRLSSDDDILPKMWLNASSNFDPIWKENIEYTDKLKGIDRAIATGSNNTYRYFEYYFRHIPHILRKNRHSIGVLAPNDQCSEQDYIDLGQDVFHYFGKGCRNITQLFLPEGFEFKPLFDVWEKHYGSVLFHNKYANNYNYHKALLLMNLDPHIDSGYLLLKERDQLHSPVGMLNYQFYKSTEEIEVFFSKHQDEIQCVVSNVDLHDSIKSEKLGAAQCPTLWDYADGIDTMEWLLHI